MKSLMKYKVVAWILPAMALLLILSACQSMPAELPLAERQSIDRLLVLIDQRLKVAPLVAQAKWNSGVPINDPVRERQILDDLTASLKNADEADKLFVRRFFQAQFDAGKIIQLALHAQWRRQAHARFDNPPDLARDIRPELDRLTPLLIAALAQVRPLLQQALARQYVQQRGEILLRGDADIDAAVRSEALGVLLERS
jgi:chorismate mutase